LANGEVNTADPKVPGPRIDDAAVGVCLGAAY
jgi:hypothetical protein